MGHQEANAAMNRKKPMQEGAKKQRQRNIDRNIKDDSNEDQIDDAEAQWREDMNGGRDRACKSGCRNDELQNDYADK